MRIRQTGYDIGGTRSAGNQTHPHLAGRLGIAFRLMNQSLLMAREHKPDGVRLIQFIKQIGYRAARIAEYRINALFLQGFYK